MVKANELRIGNWIAQSADSEIWNYPGTMEQVTTSTLRDIEEYTDHYDPIPLTPEILEKCGFVNDYNGFSLPDRMSLSFSVTKKGEFMACWLDRSLGFTVTSLHQLQNLYFALTGKELNINL